MIHYKVPKTQTTLTALLAFRQDSIRNTVCMLQAQEWFLAKHLLIVVSISYTSL